jgi:hypothetical protein
MNRAIPITTLFPDIGGVLLTNGWDHHARKPHVDIFGLALDIAQAPARQVVYIDNTPNTDTRSTCAKVASFGLENDDGVTHETR